MGQRQDKTEIPDEVMVKISESQEPLQLSAVSDQPEMLVPSLISSVCSNQCRGCVNIAGVIQNERCFEHVETILLHVITRKGESDRIGLMSDVRC